MLKLISTILIEFFFPRFCIGCGRPGKYLCLKCKRTKLNPYFGQECHVCRIEARKDFVHLDCKQSTYLDGVVVAFAYNDFVEKLIMEVKYEYYFAVVDEIVDSMWKIIRYKTLFGSELVVTSVPLAKSKMRRRGFNQAELIARQISRLLRYDYRELIKRTKTTETQVGKSGEQRRENLKDVFAVSDVAVPEVVVIVDDVMTTGSTLENCAKALKEAGVKSVYGLVFARGSR